MVLRKLRPAVLCLICALVVAGFGGRARGLRLDDVAPRISFLVKPGGEVEPRLVAQGIVNNIVPERRRRCERWDGHRHECVLSAGVVAMCSCMTSYGPWYECTCQEKKRRRCRGVGLAGLLLHAFLTAGRMPIP